MASARETADLLLDWFLNEEHPTLTAQRLTVVRRGSKNCELVRIDGIGNRANRAAPTRLEALHAALIATKNGEPVTVDD